MPLYEEYVMTARIATTISTFIGVVSQGVVVINTRMRFKHNDTPSYILLFRIHALVCLTVALSSWTVMVRQSTINNRQAFAVYGVCGPLGPHPCAIVDAFTAHLVPFSQTIFTVCIIFRCLLLYRVILTQTHVYLTVLVVYLAMLPFGIIMISAYLPLEAAAPLPQFLLREAAQVPVYFLQLEYGTQLASLLLGYTSVVYVLLPISCVCCAIMWRKLRQINRTMMSVRTLDMHRAFVKLLILEAILLCIFFLMSTLKGVLVSNYLSPELGDILSLFNTAFMSSPYPIQGVATLILVPYMRANILSWVRRAPAAVEPSLSRTQ